MKKGAVWAMAAVMFLCGKSAFCQTIVAHETERTYFEDGNATKYDGQYENTYYLDLEKNQLVRTRIFDYQRKKIVPDQTVYYIQRNLNSHPTNAGRFGLLPVIRGVGKPDADSVEIVTIEDQTVKTATATANRIVVSRAKILK